MFGMANLLPNAVVPSWYPKFLSHDPQHAPSNKWAHNWVGNQGNLKVPAISPPRIFMTCHCFSYSKDSNRSCHYQKQVKFLKFLRDA